MNLKQIFVIDTDNEKLDKVNYNFDQIIANGAGPMGAQGATGAQGFTGLQGDQGPQGAQGAQGAQGPSGNDGDTSWKINMGINGATLLPIHDDLYYENPPSIIIGIDKSDPRYNEVLEDAVLWIHRKSSVFNDNFQLTDDSSGATKVSFRLFKSGGIVKYAEGFFSGGGTIRYIADKFIYKNNTTEFANLSATQFNVKVPSLFEGNSEFKGANLKINVGSPAVDKILTSTDNQGTVAWKSISEIQAGVPVGTIVPILSSIFNDSNNFDKGFNLPNSTSPIEVYFGRGKNSYRGWYLCHGENWKKPNTANTYPVPDLSSFTYHIDANPSGAGQGVANKSDSVQTIIGGSDMTMIATFAGSQYSITSSFDTSAVSIYNPSSGGTQLEMQRFIYVVFLGEDDLYWQDNGTIAGNNSDLVFTDVTFKYAGNDVITPTQSFIPSNIGSSGSSSSGGTEMGTLVVPGNNPSYSAWNSVYNSGSWTQSTLDNAWKNPTLQYWTGNAGEDVLLYKNLSTGEKVAQGAWIKNNYLRFIKSSDGKVFDNGTGFQEGDDALSVLIVTNSLSTGGTSGTSLINTNFTLNSNVTPPSWKGSTTYAYQWQKSTDNANWVNISGATSASLTTFETGTGTVYYRVTAKINEPSTNGVGKSFYATTPVTMSLLGNTVVGNTVVNCSTPGQATGYIQVNVAPATIKWHTIGGYSSANCYCSASLVVQGVGSYSEYQGNQQQNNQYITLPNTGNYTFTLTGSGPNCSTCGSWDTRIQFQ